MSQFLGPRCPSVHVCPSLDPVFSRCVSQPRPSFQSMCVPTSTQLCVPTSTQLSQPIWLRDEVARAIQEGTDRSVVEGGASHVSCAPATAYPRSVLFVPAHCQPEQP